MGGLVLKLAAGEQVVVNGAVLENGERRSRFAVLTPNSRVLRLREALDPADLGTPARRVCYLAQGLLTGEREFADTGRLLARDISQLRQVFRDETSRALLDSAAHAVSQEETYALFKALRAMVQQEANLMAQP
jgi:flagellar protein FlbT